MAKIILGPIIGGLSHERVNLWARADSASTLRAFLATKEDLSDAKLFGEKRLEAGFGFAGMIQIEGLAPAKKYFFALSLDPNGLPPKSEFHTFETFPPPLSRQSFRFAFGSCFNPMGSGAGRAFKHLLDNHSGISLMLFLGDQIYADDWTTNGLNRVALTLDDYRAVYQNVWSNEHHRAALARIPAFMILDDHEVDNDWRWANSEKTKVGFPFYSTLHRFFIGRPRAERTLTPERTRVALQANWEHQVMHAPNAAPPLGPLYYEFEYGATAFFILDTRTQRIHNSKEKYLLGEEQWNAVQAWLLRVKDSHPVKFIVTSIAILADLFGDIVEDRWAGFKNERDQFLHFLAREGIEGVHFLTGDLHCAHAISAELYGPNEDPIAIWEYCSSPFEQLPNKYLEILDRPAKSPPLRNQKKHFAVGCLNYGIVEVKYEDHKTPQVKFHLHYEDDGQWMMKSV